MLLAYLSLIVATAAAAPNVIFITADTLRANQLGFYGHEHPTSPQLDQLAAQSLVFDDVICEVPLTGPSFCAMLSSRYPRLTGATRNGLPLPDDVPTVAQLYKNAGYHTVAVQSNWTLKEKLSGLERGFDIYDDDFHKKRWGIIKAERDGDEVTRLALELLEKWDRSQPLFAWFHYSDPHAPYKMHRKFDVAEDLKAVDGREAKVHREYDSEVAFMDDQIGQVLAALPEENTYVVFLSDHGESLWEHDYLGHGRRIYQHGLRIALTVKGPGITPGRSDAPARGVDIGPTLLGLAELGALDGAVGLDLLHAEVPQDRARVVETYGGAVPQIPGVKAIMADKGPQLMGALSEGWKLILDGDKTELYHLPTDPLELSDRSLAEADQVAAMIRLIQTWDETTERLAEQDADLTDVDLEALESLGYLE